MSKHFIALTGLMILIAAAQAQVPPAKTSAAKKRDAAPVTKANETKIWNPVAEAFEYSGNLPPKYNGTSAGGLIRWIERKGLDKKGEFEKQAEFERRVADEMSTLAGKLFAFRIDTDEVRYKAFDADKEAFLPDSVVGISFIQDVEFTTEKLDRTLGTYIGQNAYGASVKVTKVEGEWSGIRIRREDLLESKMFAEERYSSRMKLSHELKMSIDRARTVDAKNIAFLAVGSIDAPDIKSDAICLTPKVDSPYDGCTSTKYVLLKIKKFVLYDFKSGEVLYESTK